MKKLILSFIAVTGFSAAGFAQIFFADSSGAAYDTTINGVPNQSQDLNLQLLFGSSPTSFSSIPVVTLLLSSSAIPSGSQIGQTLSAAGDITALYTILDNSGEEYILGSGYENRTDYFKVLAWTGQFSSYQAALASDDPSVSAGTSAIFTEHIPGNPPAIPTDISNVGVVNLVPVPEPATYALATGGVSLASMLLFRRRKS